MRTEHPQPDGGPVACAGYVASRFGSTATAQNVALLSVGFDEAPVGVLLGQVDRA